jgi:hypothetical protein
MGQFQARQQTLSQALRLRVKWQDLCVQCGSAVSENGMRNLTAEQDRALSIIVKSYELQIRDLELTAVDGKCPSHKCSATASPSVNMRRVVIVEMQSSFGRWQASTESRDVVDSQWTCILPKEELCISMAIISLMYSPESATGATDISTRGGFDLQLPNGWHLRATTAPSWSFR